MSATVAIPHELSLKKYLGRSVVFHVLLFAAVLVASYLQQQRGASWGGVGGQLGSTKVSLVSSAGIPMPKETVVPESKAVDPTQSLHKEDPIPKPPEPKTEAEKIPQFKEEKPLPPSRKSKTLENKIREPDNAIPGKGGNPDRPTGYSQTPGPSSGVAALGQGGGDFGARYPWYVDAVRNRIRQSWDQSTIEPGVRAAHRAHAVATFRINANGSISNIRISQPSGNSSMDYSAQRALQGIDAFRPLPNDYMGAYVDVTFDFDLSLTQ
jgi:periplasmic protein TonB